MSARSVRCGSATNQTGARPSAFQYFTSSSHSCLGGAPRCRENAGMSAPAHCIGRRRSSSSRRCMARTGATVGRRSVDAVSHVAQAAETPAPPSPNTRRTDTTPIVAARPIVARRHDETARSRQRRHGPHREVRDRRHQRQRVPARERFLKEHVEHEVRTERQHEQPQRRPRASVQHRSRRRRQTAAREGPAATRPRERRTRNTTRAEARAASATSRASRCR